jgi:hypothetical protein
MHTDLDEGEVRHKRFDLLDDLGLGARVERFELHVEYRLFFRLGRGCLFGCSCIVCARCSGTCSRNGRARCRQGDFLNVQTSL